MIPSPPHPDSSHCTVVLALALLATLLAPRAVALPEDAQQALEIEASSNEMDLDRGYFIYHGTAAEPAVATQGSMRISGIDIIAEIRDGVIVKVTAHGEPARFQQQPEANQAIIHASGRTLVFDNDARMVTADVDAEFSQAGNTLNGQHIEYNLETRFAAASGGDTGERVRMLIPAAPE